MRFAEQEGRAEEVFPVSFLPRRKAVRIWGLRLRGKEVCAELRTFSHSRRGSQRTRQVSCPQALKEKARETGLFL